MNSELANFGEFTFHALELMRTRGRGESYGASPLPTLLFRCLNVEGDYDDLVLLTASTVIVYFR